MTIRYAGLLALTKLRTRLGRSLLTVAAASLVASILLVASFVSTGLGRSLSAVSDTPLSRLNLAQEIFYAPPPDRPPAAPASPGLPSAPPAASAVPSLADYKAGLAAYHPLQVYQDVTLGSYTVVGQTAGQGAEPLQVRARSDELYAASVDTAAASTKVADGTLPAAIGLELLTGLANLHFSEADPASYRVEQAKAAEDAWRGRVLTLASADGKQQLKVTLQGFLSGGGLFGGGASDGLLVPLSAAQSQLGSAFPARTQDSVLFYASFASQDALLALVKGEGNGTPSPSGYRVASPYGNPLIEFHEMEDQAKAILTYLAAVLLLAVVLAMTTTLSRIVADSERETGVFQAIGARLIDILQIYLGYSALIATLAMLLALLIGMATSLALSRHFGSELRYELLTLSGSSNLSAPGDLFGVDWLQLLEVFAVLQLAALLGSIFPLVRLLRRDPIKALRSE